MDAVQSSQRLALHRFVGQTLCQSTTINPRNLEHYIYTYWTGDIADLIIEGKLKWTVIAPQFPVYVSPKGPPPPPPNPDASFGTGITEADGEAQGVYVDIAIVMPTVQPRNLEDLGTTTQLTNKVSLHDFMEADLPSMLPGISPRCLWVSGLESYLLGELKPGPTRHPSSIAAFIKRLEKLLKEGHKQAEEQGLCLFSSWRFATQNEVILLAGAGEYYKLAFVNREWAESVLKGKSYDPETLMDLKTANEDDFGADDCERADEVNAEDWTEGQAEDMYGGPLNALQRQKKLSFWERDLQRLRAEREKQEAEREKQIKARKARHDERDRKRQAHEDALEVLPNPDLTAPIFTDAQLDAAGAVFESHSPKDFFDKPTSEKPVQWTKILRLGSELSNQYMQHIKEMLRRYERAEENRRETVFFQNRGD
jgi:hypothetical protein